MEETKTPVPLDNNEVSIPDMPEPPMPILEKGQIQHGQFAQQQGKALLIRTNINWQVSHMYYLKRSTDGHNLVELWQTLRGRKKKK